MMQLLQERGVRAQRLGTVGDDELKISAACESLRWPLGEVHDDWKNAIARHPGEELR
jgi:hypothetical protein